MKQIKKAVYVFMVAGFAILSLNRMEEVSENNLINHIEESALNYSENAFTNYKRELSVMSEEDREYFYALLTVDYYDRVGDQLCRDNIGIIECADYLINEPNKFSEDEILFFENVKDNMEKLLEDRLEKGGICPPDMQCA
jgi:hypothetical protein